MPTHQGGSLESGVSIKTYEVLKREFGKSFVDEALIEILGFDPLLDVAEGKGNRLSEPFPGISQEVAWILSDTDMAIKFARNKIMETKNKMIDSYFPKELSKQAKKDNIVELIRLMIDDIEHKSMSQSVMELWYDFVLIFTFYSDIEWRYADIMGVKGVKYVGDPAELCLQITDFSDFLKKFLENFYTRLEDASHSEKNTIFFLSEFLRVQSGEKQGVGNAMNHTYETLLSMLGTRKPGGEDLKKKDKIKNYILKQFPGTQKNQEMKIIKLLSKISRKFFQRIKE